MKLNKGEWCELFIGLSSLAKGDLKIYGSSDSLRIEGVSYDGIHFIGKNDLTKKEISELKEEVSSGDGVFEISSKVVKRVHFKKGSSNSKVDVILKYYLGKQIFQDGFGIKSSMSGKPSLLNASGVTKFRFAVTGATRPLLELKTKKLVSQLNRKNLKFVGCLNPIFQKNLKMVDTSLDNILAQILISYFQSKGSSVSDLVDNTFLDPETKKVVKKRIKDFLYYICVGMFPSKEWDGTEKICGTIIYKKNVDIFCLHRNEINGFKDFLYENSFLDTASTTRHNFGYLFKEKSQVYLDLNLQIRLR